ncbi:MAG: TonB family protein [Gemmatimonadaceae bacterium]|nr:TonB family protein [Gemmatimonadaceae bacterium]
MLRTLLESARPHSIPIGSLVASVVLHITLSVPAWKGTPAAAVLAAPESFISRALFLPPPDRLLSRSAGAERLSWVAVGAVGGPGFFMPDAPRASTFGGDMLARVAPAQAGRTEIEGASSDVVIGNDTAYSILQVDEMVTRHSDSGAPFYPGDLLQRSVEGSVRVRYVVDATGRVDTSAVRVLRSTHPQFTSAVLEALTRMRFQPATIASTPVRQVVEQDFDFRIVPPPADTRALPPPSR